MITNQQIKQVLAELNAAQLHINAACSLLVTIQQDDIIIDMTRVYPSRPMSKGELASLLGKSTRHLSRWLEPLREELRKMGVSDRAKMLSAEGFEQRRLGHNGRRGYLVIENQRNMVADEALISDLRQENADNADNTF